MTILLRESQAEVTFPRNLDPARRMMNERGMTRSIQNDRPADKFTDGLRVKFMEKDRPECAWVSSVLAKNTK